MAKARPETSLTSLIPTRTGPRPGAGEAEASAAAEAERPRRQPGRAKTVMVAGHFEGEVSFAMHELCGKLSRQKGQRYAVQHALAEAFADWFVKVCATPRTGLKK